MSPKNSPEPFTFLVLADIHFGQFSDSPEFRLDKKAFHAATASRPSMRDGLITAVLNLAEKPTAIFVPGDLTSIASPGEFKGCVEMTLGIAQQLNIPEDNVFFTYGNHDTNWRICELGTETAQFFADANYSKVAATIGTLYTKVENCILEGPIPGSGVFKANGHTLFVLNSGYYCVADQKYRHGQLGTGQLEWLKQALSAHRSLDGWNLLMVHHHPFNYTYPTPIHDVSCLEEGAEIVDLAGNLGIDLVCHGHRHHPRLFTEFRTGWHAPMTFFCGGSVAVNAHHRDTGLIPNLFHVISLQKRLTNGSAFGNVTSFEFSTEGWRPVRNCAETPLDHVHWFGSLVSQKDTDNAIRSFLETTLKSNVENTVILPSREALPAELLCCSLEQLNSRLTAIAQEFMVRMVGKYPDPVALIR